MSIVVVGSVAIDDVTTPFGRNRNAPGGSAVYFSLSASYFTEVKLVAVAGNDFPKKYIRLLQKKGINTNALEIKKGRTFRWKGRYEWGLDNPKTLDTQLNLFYGFKPVLPDNYKKDDVLFLANIDPELQFSVLSQSKARIVACDTMNFWIQHKKKALLKVIRETDILFLNEYEARQLTKQCNLLKAARDIISMGAKNCVIKKGENGVLFISKKSIYACPAFLMEDVFDPTGAGDTFAGGFLGYLAGESKADETTIKGALNYGTVMASFAVEDYDVKGLSGLSKSRISKRLKLFKKTCAI
jgi:sugar/nucleoside kinase (ribokinase family)